MSEFFWADVWHCSHKKELCFKKLTSKILIIPHYQFLVIYRDLTLIYIYYILHIIFLSKFIQSGSSVINIEKLTNRQKPLWIESQLN